MAVKVTLEYESLTAAVAALSQLDGGGKVKSDPKPAAPAKPTETAPTPPPAASSAASTETKGAKDKIYTDTPLSGMLNDAVKQGKLTQAKEILAKYGVKKGPELAPKDFDAVEADIKALLASNGEALG